MTHILLIIGNGFDLDLGLPTKYSDFANIKNREWCDFINMTKTTINQCYRTEFVDHMQKAREFENWFDIEEEVFKFVKQQVNLPQEQIGLNKKQFETLVEKLRLYICRVAIQKNKRNSSFAETLLCKLNAIQYPPVDIYTFNYTDCFEICGIVKSDNVKMHHIHGSLSYNMILGCRAYDRSKENTQLDFMYKPINYEKEILVQNLTTATEIIIFGHSLNKMDYCYFKDFFDVAESGNHICKNFTIICKNIKSEEDIKQNLNKNICLSKVETHMNINFIYTDMWNKNDQTSLKVYEDLCERIS